MRSGAEYREGLRDGRAVYLEGEPVGDVTRHAAFERQIDQIAEIYDRAQARDADDDVSFLDEDGEARHSSMWLVPGSPEDIARRRAVHSLWAEPTFGLMGRTPDHVASMLCAMVGARDVFAASDHAYPEHIEAFYERVRDEDAYLAYAIVPPQVDRSKPAHAQAEPFLYAGVAEERDNGVIVRGAQMIATSAVIADWLFVSYIPPLVEGDECYAISLVMPCSAPGLRIYPRRPYTDIANSVFDYPLSSRFDETDSLVVFDDVFVPWDHVFAYGDVPLTQTQFHETGAHRMANFQSLVRFTVKLRFAAGLARRLSEVQGTGELAPVQAMLGGQIATFAVALESVMMGAEREADMRNGMAIPSGSHIYTGMSLQRRLINDFMRAIRELAGGAFIQVPDSAEAFASEATAAHVERYFQGAGISAETRVKFLKLIWDFVGTEFAGRQLQYEMFYSASQHVVDQRVFKNYDWEQALEMVDACLDGYGLAGLPATDEQT